MEIKKTNGASATEMPFGPETEEVIEVTALESEEVFIKKSTEYLRYSFTDGELLDLSKQLARKLAEKERAERELKEVTTQLKAIVTAKENEVSTLVGESKMTGEDLQGQLFWQQEQEAQRAAALQ